MIKVRDMLRRLAEDGWVVVRQKGSHRQLKHATKPAVVTVSGHPNDTIPAGTYKQILHYANLEDSR